MNDKLGFLKTREMALVCTRKEEEDGTIYYYIGNWRDSPEVSTVGDALKYPPSYSKIFQATSSSS